MSSSLQFDPVLTEEIDPAGRLRGLEDEMPPAVAAEPSLLPDGRRPRVLIVEDEEPFRELVQTFLREEGFEVHAVGDGRCGVQWLRENPTDVIITDLCMPDTDGIELLMSLRKILSSVPIIVMSGGVAGDVTGILRAAKLLGARSALEKPFALQQLATAVRQAVAEGC